MKFRKDLSKDLSSGKAINYSTGCTPGLPRRETFPTVSESRYERHSFFESQ